MLRQPEEVFFSCCWLQFEEEFVLVVGGRQGHLRLIPVLKRAQSPSVIVLIPSQIFMIIYVIYSILLECVWCRRGMVMVELLMNYEPYQLNLIKESSYQLVKIVVFDYGV